MKVRELMSSQVVSITPEESVALAARLLARHNLGALPVCTEDGTVVGIVTDRDITVRCIAAEHSPETQPVRQIMTEQVEGITPEDSPERAAQRMAGCQVRRLPVVEEGKLVGMLSLGDLAKCSACQMEAGEALGEISENWRKAKTGED
jgi:CBS domain-containing protein